MELGERLKALRLDNKMTQTDVAEKLRPPYTSPAVRAWESGKANPRMETLKQLAEMFGVSVAYLIGEAPKEAILPSPSGVLVPVMGTAHMGSFDDMEETGLKVEVPSNVMEAHPNAFLIHADGACMNRRYPEDCYLLIDPTMEPRNDDAVYVEDEDHRRLVRVYSKGSTTLMLSPDSFSDGFEDIVASPEDPPVTLIGVVVWYQAQEDVRR